MMRDTDVGGLGPMISRTLSGDTTANEEQGKKHEQRSAMCIADGLGDEERNITPAWGSPRVEGGGTGEGGSDDVLTFQAREGGGGAQRGEADQDTSIKREAIREAINGEAINRELALVIHGRGSTTNVDTLSSIPDEIILSILTYLDISDIFSLIKTSHRLRTISLDPLLHHQRLLRAKNFLSHALPQRPPLEALRSPRRIWLSRRDFITRELSRNLLKIRLNKKLGMRPDPGTLLERGVLPKKCLRRWSGQKAGEEDHAEEKVGACSCDEGKGKGHDRENTSMSMLPKENPNTPYSAFSSSLDPGSSSFSSNSSSSLITLSTSYPQSHCTYITHLSPPLLTTLLTLQKQLLRDRLSSFVRSSYPHDIDLAQEKLIKHNILPAASPSHSYPHTPTPTPQPTRRPSVRYLVNRFSSRARDSIDGSFGEMEARWGRGAEGRKKRWRERRERVGEEVEGAGRARVRRLRSFFEELSRGKGM